MLLIGIVASVRNKLRLSAFLQSDKHIPVVLSVGVARRIALQDLRLAQESIGETTGFKEFQSLENSFNVHYDDLLAPRADMLPPDPEEWKDFLEGTQEEISRFVRHISGGYIFHVFIRGPASLAFGLGAVLGTRNRVFAYHYVSGRYRPVLDLSHDSRRIKTGLSTETFDYIQTTYPETFGEDTAVVLDMAGHVASGDVRAYLATWDQPPPVVQVSNTYGGNLTVDDWVPCQGRCKSVPAGRSKSVPLDAGVYVSMTRGSVRARLGPLPDLG